MKKHFFALVILIAMSSVSRAQDAKLTVDLAKKLLPEAAGISIWRVEITMKRRAQN